MADEEPKKPKTAEEVLDHANALFVKARNVALAAAAAVLAIGGVAITTIDQWNVARAHYLEQKTAELIRKDEQIDQHLEKTDDTVKNNGARLDMAGAPSIEGKPQ